MELPREIRFSHAGAAFRAILVERAPAGTNAVCSLCPHSILEGCSFYTTDPPNFQVHAECTRQYLSSHTAAATVYGRNTSFAPPDNSRSLNPGSHFGHSPSFPPYHLLSYYPYPYPSYYAQPHGYGPAPPSPPLPPHQGHWNSVIYGPAHPQHGYAPVPFPPPPPPPPPNHHGPWNSVFYAPAQPQHVYAPFPAPPPPPTPHHGASWNSVDNAPPRLPPPPHHHNDTWTTVLNTVQTSAIGAFMQILFQSIFSNVLFN